MDSELRDKLFAVIRSGMGLDTPSIDLSRDESDVLMKLARKQSILPIVYQGLSNLRIPSEWLDVFEKPRMKTVFQVVQLQDAQKRVMTALESESVPYILLKGAVLRNLYPRADLRTSCDIDVLVREEDLEKAESVVVQNAGFKMLGRNYHDISMIDTHVHLELHFNIKENMENIDKLLIKAWDYASPTEDGIRCEFSPEFQLFHVIAHMSYHMVHGGLGIRPFLDLWLLRHKTEYDEIFLRNMCSECNILTFYEKCCKMVDAWMNGDTIDPSLIEFETYCLNSGVFGSSETVLASKQRTKRGTRYLWERVFMSRANLETEFPELKQKPYRLASCQIKRWTRLLSKKKRIQVRQELKDVRQLDPKTVESFDRLLSSLGL